MTAGPGGGGRGTDRHFDRIYKRLDDINARVSRLERTIYMAGGGIGAVALFNLASNLSQLAGGGG